MFKQATVELELEGFEHESAVLPCQVHPAVNPQHARSGERLLMLAVLADAINIFLRDAGERRLIAETREWIRGIDDQGQPVSFKYACEALGIDAGALRRQLFRLKYGEEQRCAQAQRSALMLKPAALSRGPVKVGVNQPRRRRITS